MRICIDGRMTGVDGTGVSTYARTLIATLRSAGVEHDVLTDGRDPAAGDGPLKRTDRLMRAMRGKAQEARVVPGGLLASDIFRIAHVHFRIHRRLLELVAPGLPGVMHWTYPLPLRMRGWRNLYTVHDLIPLTHPDLTSIRPRTHRRVLDAIVDTDASIVTVSETVQREIVETLALPPARVVDLSQAVLPPSPPEAPPMDLVPDGYYLSCGTIEPRKNIARLAAAHRASGTTRPLVLAGPEGWRAGDVLSAIAGFPLVRRLRYVERGTLATLLMNARALLFPSLVEGFGLPIIEAMSVGTPVLTSSEGAMRETAKGAALLVNPLDVEAIAAAIARLDTDQALCGRLRELGHARASDFTPEAYARRLLTLYRRETEAFGQRDD